MMNANRLRLELAMSCLSQRAWHKPVLNLTKSELFLSCLPTHLPTPSMLSWTSMIVATGTDKCENYVTESRGRVSNLTGVSASWLEITVLWNSNSHRLAMVFVFYCRSYYMGSRLPIPRWRYHFFSCVVRPTLMRTVLECQNAVFGCAYWAVFCPNFRTLDSRNRSVLSFLCKR